MSKYTAIKLISVLGIDLAKNVFHLHGVDEHGKTVFRKKISRNKLLEFIVQLPSCLIGMEACGGSHYWARKFIAMGHDVKLMNPKFVKAYVKSNKNDAIDAEAICEAVQRPNMRFVPVKSIEQQDIQAIHRLREQTIKNRTALGNQIRGLLMENGVVVSRGITSLGRAIPEILQDADNDLSDMFRELLSKKADSLQQLNEEVAHYNNQLEQLSSHSEVCRRLMTIPGIGSLIATTILAAAGDASVFHSGREMAAWLGIVPRQYSTGGKVRLMGISKRGDAYLRKMIIHGARSVIRFADKKDDRLKRWATGVKERRGKNIATVALANKMVRIAWVMITRPDETYRPFATA